jgi:ethanolamine utilization protein EutN
MRIAEVIGTVTLNRCHPTFDGSTLKLAVPLKLDDLTSDGPYDDDALVVYDEFGAGMGSRIMLSEGGEAAQPFKPNWKPVDAYNAGLIDQINIDPKAMK